MLTKLLMAVGITLAAFILIAQLFWIVRGFARGFKHGGPR